MEVVCGTGEFTAMAAKAWPRAHLTAIDISPQAIAMARNRPELATVGVTLRCADFWQATLPPSDVVFCFDAIHHLGDMQTVLTLLRSLVNEGGALVGNVWTVTTTTSSAACARSCTWPPWPPRPPTAGSRGDAAHRIARHPARPRTRPRTRCPDRRRVLVRGLW
ncbi:MAG: class I SAM-dependent methyltransferase [Pseudonocardiaceae bacterium]